METEIKLLLIGLGIPFTAFTIMFFILVHYNKTTTGEIKNILPPDHFLKILTVIMVVVVVFILRLSNLIETSVTAALLGSVITGAVTSIKSNNGNQ